MAKQKRRDGEVSRLGDGWWLLATSAIFFGAFLWLVLDAMLDQKKPLAGIVFLPLLGLLTIIVFLKLSWKPGRQSFWSHLRSGVGGATVAMALLQGASAIASVLGLFEPRAATTKDTDAILREAHSIGNGVDELNRILRLRFPEDPPILTEILGRWGEKDTCALVWEISIIQRGQAAALQAEIVKRPAGVEPYRLLAEITDAEDYVLDVTGEEPASARGSAAVFNLNPATQRLVWNDKARPGGVEEYVRCAAS